LIYTTLYIMGGGGRNPTTRIKRKFVSRTTLNQVTKMTDIISEYTEHGVSGGKRGEIWRKKVGGGEDSDKPTRYHRRQKKGESRGNTDHSIRVKKGTSYFQRGAKTYSVNQGIIRSTEKGLGGSGTKKKKKKGGREKRAAKVRGTM